MNLAPNEADPAGDDASCGGSRSVDQTARTIVTCVGMAGASVAAVIGYLIESTATGGAAGLAGAVVCPLVFGALYRSFPQPGA